MIDIARDLPPLGHVGYVVDDVERNVQKFRESLGLDNFRIYDYVAGRAWASGQVLSPCELRIAMGSVKNDVKIELIQPVAGDTPHARFLAEKGPGLHHVAFYSNEYEQWREYFRTLGAEIVFEAEAEDEVVGYRRSLYARVEGMVGLVEITEIAYKRH